MKMNKRNTVMLNLFQHLFTRPRNKFGVTQRWLSLSKPLLSLLLALSLISCSNSIQPDSQFTTESTSNEQDIAYIILGEPTFGNNSRTIAPGESVDYNSSNLTNLVFTAQKKDTNGDEIGTAITLASAEAYSGLSNKKIPIEPGTYDLKLTATLSGAPMEGIILNKTISSGLNTSISFQLKAPSDFIWGGCNLSITFNNSDTKISKVTITLKKCNKEEGTETLDGTKTLIETKEYNSSDFEGAGSTKTIKYMRNVANESQRLEYGYYYITFDFYKIYDAPDNRIDLLNSISQYMYIDKGHWTTWTSTSLNYNDVYNISYKFYVNDTEDSTYTPTTGLVFPGAYSSRSEEIVIPAVSKDGYTFLGWYTDSAFTTRLAENASNQQVIAAGSTGSKELYARFIKPELYVSSSATDDSGSGFSETAAFQTFGAAISKIDSFTTPLNWTIYIDGEISGNQTVAFTTNTPSKLTISGKTGNSTDKLTGSSGTTLTVDVSQTFETDISNLTITGGSDSGLKCTKGIVSLLDGAKVTGNTASGSGSGVYVSAYGSLKMGGSAVVTTDNDVYLSSSGQSIEIASALSTTNTDPVARITPYEITDSQAFVSGETLSTSYNRFLVSPVTNEGVTTMYKIGSDGKIANIAVGDIVFTDNTIMEYTSGLSLSDDVKAKAVGVVYNTDDSFGIPKGILGKKNSYGETGYSRWKLVPEGGSDNGITLPDSVKSGTNIRVYTNGDNEAKGAIVEPENTSEVAQWYTDNFSSSDPAALFDIDGSDNLSTWTTAYSSDTANEYKVLKYCTDYSSTILGLDTGSPYSSGWYMPTLAEMVFIYNKYTNNNFQDILEAIGGNRLRDGYWTSTIPSDADDDIQIWIVDFGNRCIKKWLRTYDSSVCCVRKL